MKRTNLVFVVLNFLIINITFSQTVTLNKSTNAISENQSVIITATLDAPTSQDVIVNFDLSGTAINDLDFTTNFVRDGVTVAGGNGLGEGSNQLNTPIGIFINENGEIYIADRNNNRIQKWIPGATEGITVAGGNGSGSEPNQLFNPLGVFVDENGEIYIADSGNERIQKWMPGASEGITVAGGNGSGSAANQLDLTFTTGIFVDLDENIFIADSRNDRIQKWTPGASEGITVAGGNGKGSAANQLNNPRGLFLGENGEIYIADSNNERIQKWMPGASEGITVAGGNGSGSAANQLNNYGLGHAIFVDLDGSIFIADSGNSRVQKWIPGASEGITVAGGNGEGSESNQLFRPNGVYVDLYSNIYVSDKLNHRVQKYQNDVQIIIPVGETMGTLTITGIEDDLNNEGDETIIISASSAQNVDISAVQDIAITLLDNTRSLTLKENPFISLSNGAVSWGDFDRDGDKDVAIMGQSNTAGAVTTIYENQDGNFVDLEPAFTKLYAGDISWVDINNDGWIDLVVSGLNGTPQTKLYINNNGLSFESTNDYGLPQLFSSEMDWGDLDNDGDIDLAISGINSQNEFVFGIYYREDNQNNFIFETESMNTIPAFINGDLKIIDIDLDGDNDIVYNGEDSSGNPVGGIKYNSLINSNNPVSGINSLKNSTIEIARINSSVQNRLSIITSGEDASGNIIFNADPILAGINGTGTELQFPKLRKGDIAVADFNNDGTNDIILTGEDQSGLPTTKLYLQDGVDNFSESNFELIGLRESTADFVDYDMDGDLDIFLSGLDSKGSKVVLYESEIANKKNAPPSKIANLAIEDLGNGNLRFSWDTPNDDFADNLGYILRIGTTPGGSEISHPNSNFDTGSRLITAPPTIYTNFYEIQLNPDNYYCSVQAVDTGLKGGVFSDELQFSLTYEWKILNQGGIIDKTINGNIKPILKYVDIDNDNDLDLLYGSGESGSVQLFKFNGERLILSNNNLFNTSQLTNIEVGDVNGDGFVDIINNNYGGNLDLFINTGSSFDLTTLDAGLYNGKARITDLNNDGITEVLFTGLTSENVTGIPKLLLYEYDNSSIPATISKTDISDQISQLKFSSFDLGDIDNDFDIDYVISGFNAASGLESYIYENTTELGSAVTFNETLSNFNSIRDGSTDLIDFDSDGDLDVVLTGTSRTGDIFEIFINKLNEANTDWPILGSTGLAPIRESYVDYGDFNGDGYIDLLYSGIIEGQGNTTKLSEYNPSTNTYTESTFDVSMFINAQFEFGDIDGDGDLDFTIAGEDKNNAGQNIFRTYLNVRNESANVTGKVSSIKGSAASFVVNAPPSVPIGLAITNIDGETVNTSGVPFELTWQSSTDDHTPSIGLTYGLKIGMTPGGEEIMAANANASGFRKIVQKGNVEHNLKWQLRLPPNTYYFAIQAIDASNFGSAFSNILEFTINENGDILKGDDDKDGVSNDLDLCPNSNPNASVDENGCFTLPFNNYTIQVVGETCVDKNNGQIIIKALETQNYILTLDGTEYSFNNGLTIDNLPSGPYTICVTIPEESNYEQCFKLNVAESQEITGKMSSSKTNKSTTSIEIFSGTKPYGVFKNGEKLFQTNSNLFNIEVNQGDLISVTSKFECEGLLQQRIGFDSDVLVYPNPTSNDFNIALKDMDIKEVSVSIYNTYLQLLSTTKHTLATGKTRVSLKDKPLGVYILKIKLDDNTIKTFKVIKK